MSDRPIRALVVDDSPTARALLTSILDSHPKVEVVGTAADGAEAVSQVLALRPSVVVMDIEMPGVDGFAATERIMNEAPTPIVIVTSRHDPADVALTLNATRLGALTVLPKPPGPASPGFNADAARLVSIVAALSEVKVVRRRARSRPPERLPAAPHTGVRAIGVGASTGGPAALHAFLSALPGNLGAPVLVVQHIATGFVGGLVRWLSLATPLEVTIAEQGAALGPGTVYVAPDGAHLQVSDDERVDLDDGPARGGFRPCASNLFMSLARVYGPAAAAVVLTGMGTDGLEGARAVRARGGLVLAQDEDTSVVFGMPKAVTDARLATVVGPVETLALKAAASVTMRPR